MKKLMEISNCYSCHKIGTVDRRTHFCTGLDRKEIDINIFKEIPPWCPLPDGALILKKLSLTLDKSN